MSLTEIRKEISKQKNPKQAVILQRFFKTGKGEYGEGDVFYGWANIWLYSYFIIEFQYINIRRAGY